MEGTTSRLSSFVNEMREFPCSFNVGNANFDFTNHAFDSRELKEPHLQKNIWSNIKKYLEEDVDELDPDLVDPTWKDNLRVRVYAELGDFDKAEELNKEILERNPENLVALANSGFLFAFKFQFGKTKTIIEKLKERKNSQEFDRVKYEAICEQGYTYYKFSECNKTNIQSAILIMEHCVTNIPNFEKRFDDIDEKLKLMLACLYRRYVNPAINVDVKQWIIKAEKLFNSIKESTSSNSVKSICYVELARLNKNGIENGIPVSNESVIELCQLAGELNPKSKRVLIVAGPMLVSLKEHSLVENMLMTIISTGNNTEAHNYLGGVYFTQAKENKKILRAQHFLNGTAVSNDLMKPLVNFIQKIPAYSEKNTFVEKAVASFKVYLESDCSDPIYCCRIAFKMFQCRQYDAVLNICQKIVGETRSKLSVYHFDAYFILSLCYAITFVNSPDEENLEELEKKCLEMVVCCLRCAAVLLIQERTNNVVRAIKLEAAKDIFTKGKQGVCHDGIWEEIFNEEFQIDQKSKTFQVALLNRLIQGTSCDVFIVENIQTTNHTGNDVTVSQVLKDVIINMCGLNVITSSEVSDPDEIRQVISRLTVLIVVQKQKHCNMNETNLDPIPTRSDGNDSSVLTRSLDIFAASSKEGTTPRHVIIAVIEDENHEDELRIPKELSGHSQLTFTLEEVKFLEEMSSSREDGQVDVFMKLFKTIVRQC